LREADRLNRKLTARLLVDGVGDNTAASSTGKASDAPAETAAASDCQRRIAELEAELKEERALNRRLTERLLEMGNERQQHS